VELLLDRINLWSKLLFKQDYLIAIAVGLRESLEPWNWLSKVRGHRDSVRLTANSQRFVSLQCYIDRSLSLCRRSRRVVRGTLLANENKSNVPSRATSLLNFCIFLIGASPKVDIAFFDLCIYPRRSINNFFLDAGQRLLSLKRRNVFLNIGSSF